MSGPMHILMKQHSWQSLGFGSIFFTQINYIWGNFYYKIKFYKIMIVLIISKAEKKHYFLPIQRFISISVTSR